MRTNVNYNVEIKKILTENNVNFKKINNHFIVRICDVKSIIDKYPFHKKSNMTFMTISLSNFNYVWIYTRNPCFSMAEWSKTNNNNLILKSNFLNIRDGFKEIVRISTIKKFIKDEFKKVNESIDKIVAETNDKYNIEYKKIVVEHNDKIKLLNDNIKSIKKEIAHENKTFKAYTTKVASIKRRIRKMNKDF